MRRCNDLALWRATARSSPRKVRSGLSSGETDSLSLKADDRHVPFLLHAAHGLWSEKYDEAPLQTVPDGLSSLHLNMYRPRGLRQPASLAWNNGGSPAEIAMRRKYGLDAFLGRLICGNGVWN